MMSPGWWLSNHKLCVLYFWRVALSWTGGQLNIRCSIINTCARLSNHHPEGNAALSFNSMLAVEEKLKCERKKGPYFISGSWTPFVVNYLHLTVMWKCLTLKNYCYEHGLGSDEQNDPSLFLTMGKTGARGGKTHTCTWSPHRRALHFNPGPSQWLFTEL